MNRERYDEEARRDPRSFVPYVTLFSTTNVNNIKETAEAQLAVYFPSKRLRVDTENIKSIMWELYTTRLADWRLIPQETVNLLVNNIRGEIEMEEYYRSLDPWINQQKEQYGITNVDPAMKLNHRRTQQTVDFAIRR